MASLIQGEEWEPGLPLYNCDSCTFSTVELEAAETHVEKAHPRERATEVEILGPTGERIPSIPVPDESPNQVDAVVVPRELLGPDEDDNKEDGDNKKDSEPPWWRR